MTNLNNNKPCCQACLDKVLPCGLKNQNSVKDSGIVSLKLSRM